MNRCFLLIIAAILTKKCGGDDLSCDKGWHRYKEKCFFERNVPVSIDEMIVICEGMGSVLASFHSREEAQLLNKIGTSKVGYWFAMYRPELGKKVFKYKDGSTYDYQNWWPGEPDAVNHPVSNCSVIYMDGNEARLMDEWCSSKHPQLCQKAAVNRLDEMYRNLSEKIDSGLKEVNDRIDTVYFDLMTILKSVQNIIGSYQKEDGTKMSTVAAKNSEFVKLLDIVLSGSEQLDIQAINTNNRRKRYTRIESKYN